MVEPQHVSCSHLPTLVRMIDACENLDPRKFQDDYVADMCDEPVVLDVSQEHQESLATSTDLLKRLEYTASQYMERLIRLYLFEQPTADALLRHVFHDHMEKHQRNWSTPICWDSFGPAADIESCESCCTVGKEIDGI